MWGCVERCVTNRRDAVTKRLAVVVWVEGGAVGIFFFNDTATTEIYTLSLHDALPIYTPSDTGVAERTTLVFVSKISVGI